ncbi:hypothetical protein F0A17_00135 [Billgrantia pellis]|uniref:Uncharacterized protein n=1 Tax=Billgrantia pellis TaxID=2606936 RepID=A0A7V7KIT3_9GAMM|nr:hypothetical protein [Halomonas pellis]KAA0014119.1 hypothetical protein F0A17_00135 [Halomonas pellis]
MFEWLSRHVDALTVLTNIGTLLIWLVYAQLLYLGFRRQRRPRLLINRGRKSGIDALCIISNMSAEPIFLQHIIAELRTSIGVITVDVTDRKDTYDQRAEVEGRQRQGRNAASNAPIDKDGSHQGPLEPGGFVHIDSFGELTLRLAQAGNMGMDGLRPTGDVTFLSLTIRLICVYGSEDLPVGAERQFDYIDHEPSRGLVPATWDTKRLASRRQRHRLCRQVDLLNRSDVLRPLPGENNG